MVTSRGEALTRPERLAAVDATRLLDTGADEAFDRLARLAGALLKVPFAFVTVVDGSRSFWKSCIGVDATDLLDRQNPVEESFCQYVIHIDEPLIVGDARLNEVTRQNPSIEKMGVIAWAGYPLRSIDGHVLGTFCVVDTVVRDWTSEEVEILGALAGAVEGEIRLRIMLDQSAQQTQSMRREMQTRERLASLTELLASADTTELVVAAITQWGPDVLGASVATLGLIDPTRRHLAVHGIVADEQALGGKYHTIALTENLPVAEAVASRTPILLGSVAEIASRYPHVVDDVMALGFSATASLPLLHSDGTTLGGLTVGWSQSTDFSPTERSMLRTVSLMCAQAIERAQLGDLRRALVESLQRELLHSVPEVSGLTVAVRYMPATVAIGIGGDWYDIVDLDDGRAVIVVGDVAGHGIEAAARMAQVRGAINALSRMHADDLGIVFVEAERMLRHLDDGYIATVLIALVDPHDGTVSYVAAGHPAPVIINADRTATILQDGRRPVLGSGRGRTQPGVAPLPEGAVLIAFTDGLVERRDQTTDIGTDRLVAAAVSAPHPRHGALNPELLASRLISELIADRNVTDDLALVVVQRVAPTA